MKKRLAWLSCLPCFAVLSLSAASANDPPETKETKKVEVVVIGEQIGEDVQSKIKESLEKANLSAEAKAKVLAEVEKALAKVGKKAKAEKKSDEKAEEKEEIQQQVTVVTTDKEGEEPKVMILNKQGKPLVLNQVPGVEFKRILKGDLPKNLTAEGFRIGITCEVVGDDGEEGDEVKGKAGLIVRSVLDESPAKEAGVAAGDILIEVNGKDLQSIEQLTKAVQASGKEDKQIEIKIEHDGKTKVLELKPTKMKVPNVDIENLSKSFATSGFVFDGDSVKDMQEKMARIVPANPGAFAFRMDGEAANLKKEIEELKSELAEIKSLVKELKALNQK